MLDVEPIRERHEALIRCSRQHAQAAGLGVVLLGLAGGWWAAVGLLNLPLHVTWPYALVAACSTLLVGGGSMAIARARCLPLIALALRDVWRAAAVVLGALALAVSCCGALLRSTHHEALAPVVITLLVGLHMLPLARIFHLAMYRQTGLWLIALALSVWAFAPPVLGAGSAPVALWPSLLDLGGAGILWATALGSLRRLVIILRAAEASVP